MNNQPRNTIREILVTGSGDEVTGHTTASKAREWAIDIDMKMRDKKAFMSAMAESAEKDDDEIIFPYFAKVIKAWPFDGDPTKPESYGDLRLSEFSEVAARVGAAFQALTERINAK